MAAIFGGNEGSGLWWLEERKKESWAGLEEGRRAVAVVGQSWF